MSSQPQPDVLRISENSSKTVWRVYFDREEVESEQTRGEGEEPEITIQYRAKFIEVTLATGVTPVPIDILRNEVIKEITAYDVSSNVNGFILNGNVVWLDKDTRSALAVSYSIILTVLKSIIELTVFMPYHKAKIKGKSNIFPFICTEIKDNFISKTLFHSL